MKSLIIADIHANLASLEAVLESESSWDEVLFLGDAVVGGPHPNEVLSRLSELDGVFLMGNHDREVLEIDLARKATLAAQRWKQWTRERLSPDSVEFLASFIDTGRLERDGQSLRLLHGELSPEWGERLWPDSPEGVFAGLAAQHPERWIFVAHSHVQFRRLKNGKAIVNPGSVGQPRLGQSLACYAVLEDGVLHMKAVQYDVAATCAAMDRVPLESSFVEAWKEGYQTGGLPVHRQLRDFTALQAQGFR